MGDIRIAAVNTIQAVDEWLKVLSGNLTGSNVTGYRSQHVSFADVLTEKISASDTAHGNLGSVSGVYMPSGGAQIKETRTDFSQGSLQSTGQPTDLGIQGNGFFILSKTPNPTSVKDLTFTRNGSFHFDFVAEKPTEAGVTQAGTYRLVNQDGMFVMGFQSTDNDAYKPDSQATLPGTPITPTEIDHATTGISGLQASASEPGRNAKFGLKPITVPFKYDPSLTNSKSVNTNFTPSFNSKGALLLNSDVPTDATGATHLVQFVALATFGAPESLDKLEGGSTFGMSDAAGQVRFGVADNPGGDNFAIGNRNVINAGSLEASNSNVNTTLPELTIAQKSFTANVKIVSVGNSLIDDVNNLIR